MMAENKVLSDRISRSTGLVTDFGYIVGGGYEGYTKELDALVVKAAELLHDHFGMDVTIRFNSDRLSGGAWIVDSEVDSFNTNNSIGLTATLYNSQLRDMSFDEQIALPQHEFYRLRHEPDSIFFSSAINLKKTVNSVSSDSKYLLIGTEYLNFESLDDAAAYLFSHVTGLKDHGKTKKTLDTVIESAALRSSQNTHNFEKSSSIER